MNNYAVMHPATVGALMDVMLPMHYAELYAIVKSDDGIAYRHPTESYDNRAREKYRQYYHEHKRETICFISGGFLAMRYWFPQKETQARLLYTESYRLPVEYSLTVEAAHEYMQRAKYMIDYNKDRSTLYRTGKSITAYIVEFAIRDYFKAKYPQNFIDASNSGKYQQASSDDFSIITPHRKHIIDVKSVDFDRHAKKGKILVRGNFCDDSRIVTIIGWLPSELMNQQPPIKWRHIDSLIVWLNCLIANIDYQQIVRRIKQ